MIKFMLAFLIVIHTRTYSYSTGGVEVSKSEINDETNYTIKINNTNKILTIPSDCNKVRVYDPALNSKSDPQNYYFLMKLTCTDIIKAEDYYEAKQNNSYKQLASENMTEIDLIKYQCVMNVTFDNNEHCCCPVRNNDFKSKNQKWLP